MKVSATLKTIIGDKVSDLYTDYLEEEGMFALLVCSHKSQIIVYIHVGTDGELTLAKADFTGPGNNN